MDKDVETSTDVEALRVEVMRLRTAIRQHKGECGHKRCMMDHVLHSVLPDGDLGGVVVTGTPGGDGECWHFVVTADEYRRVMGEEDYEAELKWRRELEAEYPAFRHESIFTLGPSDLLRAAGLERVEPVTLWLQLRKPDAPQTTSQTADQ